VERREVLKGVLYCELGERKGDVLDGFSEQACGVSGSWGNCMDGRGGRIGVGKIEELSLGGVASKTGGVICVVRGESGGGARAARGIVFL
jgi:hypothetical protein